MKFANAIRQKQAECITPVIPDIKCISPKHGDLLDGRCPIEMACLLKGAGAPVLSVVTKESNFGGSMNLLCQIVQKTGLPVLRKDFITSIDDLKETVDSGASAVLLMYETQTEQSLADLYHAALQMELEVLVETHTAAQMQMAVRLGSDMIGINNRDIKKLEQDDGTVDNTCYLASLAPKDALVISESGIQTPDDVRRAIAAGADAALVGTALWQAADMSMFYKQLCGGAYAD